MGREQKRGGCGGKRKKGEGCGGKRAKVGVRWEGTKRGGVGREQGCGGKERQKGEVRWEERKSGERKKGRGGETRKCGVCGKR